MRPATPWAGLPWATARSTGPAYTIDDHLYWDKVPAAIGTLSGKLASRQLGKSHNDTWVPRSDAIISPARSRHSGGETVTANSVTFVAPPSVTGGTLDLGTTGTTVDVEGEGNSATIASLVSTARGLLKARRPPWQRSAREPWC